MSIGFIKKFYKHYTKTDLKENNDIIKSINNIKFNKKKVLKDFEFMDENFNDIIITYTKNINDICMIFKDINKDFVEKLNPYKDILNQSKAKIEEPTKADLSFKKESVLNNLNNIKLSYSEKIIYLLYMLIEKPIKYNDLIQIKINQDVKNDENYYDNGKIHLNSNRDTQYNKVIDLPIEIINIIDDTKEYLLGSIYTESNISKIINTVFKKVYGIKYNKIEFKRLRYYEK
jgi:hypothetical protein